MSIYLALGDSMSIDLYPSLDAAEREGIPAPGVLPLGASSLLLDNDDDRWPDLRGRDLRSRAADLRLEMLCADGATTGHVLDAQLAAARRVADQAVVVTLTVGGNDLLDAYARSLNSPVALTRAVERVMGRFTELVERVRAIVPRAPLILTTVYDPTDGTGRMPGYEAVAPLPLDELERFNQHVRERARELPNTALADAHRHFRGHGMSAPEGERWYWRHHLIEPSARGASELRRLWWEALERMW